MSIQSEAERIKGEVAAQEALIAQISAVLDGKAGGGTAEPAEEKDVNFWDYDGTLLHSYTLDELQALTELPEGPDGTDLIAFHGWNWTLDALKAHAAPMDVGALYSTRDGLTHLFIHVCSKLHSDITMYYNQDVAGAVLVDWGDGSPVESSDVAGTVTSLTHSYAEYGEYDIRLRCTAGNCYLGYGGANTNLFAISLTKLDQYPYLTLLQRAYLGSNTTLGLAGFRYCKHLSEYTQDASSGLPPGESSLRQCGNLKHVNLCPGSEPLGKYALEKSGLDQVSLPYNTETIPTSAFRDCKSLRRVRTPKTAVLSGGYHFFGAEFMTETPYCFVGGGGQQEFRACYSITEYRIPDGQTSINRYMFYYCYSLSRLTIPASVTTIGAYAFNQCTSMDRLCFLSETPPTVDNVNAFTSVPTTCVVEVPAASLEAYQNATNYSGIAAQMIGV